MAAKVKKSHFAGSSKLFTVGDEGLANLIRGLAQDQGKRAAATLSDLTDNSGGTSGGNTIPALGLLAPYTSAGTDMVSKTNFDAWLVKARNAISTVAAQISAIHAVVPAGGLTDSTGGTSGAGTIAALGDSGTAVSAAGVSVTSANSILADYRDRIAELQVAVNKIAVACGIAPIGGDSGGGAVYTSVLAAIPVATGSSVAGAALSTAAKTAADTVLQAYEDAVATLAAKLNACTSDTAPAVKIVAA